MIILGDYHTHTKYSRRGHGKGTILENASVAANKGLKQIAITDHGFNHFMYGVRRKDIPEMREEILTAREVSGVDILLGVEANLISLGGDIDLKEEDYENLDIILMGHHKMVNFEGIKNGCRLGLDNLLRSPFGPSKDRLNRNTTAFLKAIDKNPIDIITHLNYGCPTDTLAVAKLAKQKGVLIEINGKRVHFTDRELITMAQEGVKFIINSDAHSPDRVGEVNNSINQIIRLDIPTSLVVNLDKLPKFNKKRN